MKVIDPLHEDKKLVDHLDGSVTKVLIFAWHGLGDIIMLQAPLNKLRFMYPQVQFDLALALGLGQEDICKDALLVTGDEASDFSSERFAEYDLVCKIHMPMNEGQIEFTKGEWSCKHEIGIDPVSGHREPDVIKNRLVGCHFQITCLPDSANVPYDVAKQVWEEIKQAGFIPIETLMKHVFHNPVNEKYDFIDRDVRDVLPKVSTLAGLIKSCGAFICGVSGNFHVAMSVLPPERIMLLEKDFLAPSFTKETIGRIDVKDYIEGSIYTWLRKIDNE